MMTRYAPPGHPVRTRRPTVRDFVYSDGWVDDARLVVLNAMDAAERGTRILTHTRCESIARQGATWQASLRDWQGQNIKVTARCVVNAAGPWVGQFLEGAAQRSSSKSVRLVKGSHIVVKRLFQHDHAYIFQNPDGRIVFAIPYEKEFTLIGTTDVEYHGDTSKVSISAEEIDYLCTLSNRYFDKAITPANVVWSYAGVRPLLEDAAADASAVTRDYQLDFDVDGAPLLSVFGGKITTFRKLAEEAVDLIAPALANTHLSWTANACLPGGDIFNAKPDNRSVREFDRFISNLQRDHAWLPAPLLARYARAYGSRTQQLLAGCKTMENMGEEILSGLFAVEVDYLMRQEWARCAADILWRRSKLGLHLPAGSDVILDNWIAARNCGTSRVHSVAEETDQAVVSK